MKHKSDDYKISAVKYYLKNKESASTSAYNQTLCGYEKTQL